MHFCPWCVVSQIPGLVLKLFRSFVSLHSVLPSGLCSESLLMNLFSRQSLSVDSDGDFLPPVLQHILRNAWSYLLLNSGMTSLSMCGLGAHPPISVLCILPLSSLTLGSLNVWLSTPTPVFSAKLQQKEQ